MDPTFKQAVIQHFIQNYRQTNNPYAFARQRIGEIREAFRALSDEEKNETRPIDNRPDSEHTRDVRLELDRLNGKE